MEISTSTLESSGARRMLDRKQEQHVAEGSTAIQAGGNVNITYTGLTYSEVRAVALDVFKANFHKLAGIARETALARAEEITERFLSKLQNEYPRGLQKATDPDFQYVLFSAQRDYARSGDKDLGDLLVDLLVERSKCEQRGLLQIVLNEALNTVPKLTENQLAALAVIFTFRYSRFTHIVDHQSLGDFFDRYVLPFLDKLVTNMASYQHLEFTGCGKIEVTELSLESALAATYQGLFTHGFEKKEVAERGITIGLDSRFFIRCLNDPAKIQVNALAKEDLEAKLKAHSVSPEDSAKIMQLFDLGKINDDEVRALCIKIRPYMARLFDTWSNSPMKNFTLTSVGIAIAHANIQRYTGKFADLSIWINE